MLPTTAIRRPRYRTCALLLSIAVSLAMLGCQSTPRSTPANDGRPLLAYVGTFSSPLKDVLPTQVDLPPGNGRGIHGFRIDRATGAMTPTGIYELGTSPSFLALNH